MRQSVSCSACCGLFNLRLTDSERTAWVQKNTETFLATDISKAENIVGYRKEREALTLPLRIRDDVYSCPFVGFMAQTGPRTGCLLHPQGSPHPQIALWQHPQNFSFYGEGICLAYDCLAKERRAHGAEFFRWAEGACERQGSLESTARTMRSEPLTVFAYGRLASDHTLHRALAGMDISGMNLVAFFDTLADLYARHNVVTTSFEDIEKNVPGTAEELCRFLACRIGLADAESLLLRTLTPSPSPGGRGEKKPPFSPREKGTGDEG